MPVTTYQTLKIWINGPDYGWSEEYNLKTTNYTDSEAAALTLIKARARLLAANLSVANATITDKATKGDSLLVNGFDTGGIILDAETTFATDSLMNDPEVSLLYRFDTGGGHYINRHIRGLRDAWVADNALTVTVTGAYAIGGPYLTYATGGALDTSADVIANFISRLRDMTYLVTPSKDPLSPFTQTAFSYYQFRRISSRNVGKRFGNSKGRQPAFA